MKIKYLTPSTPFPDVSESLNDPEGLLAVSSELSISRLITAYQHGIFPWYAEDQPVLWWSPNPRAVLFFDELRISRSLKKIIRHSSYTVTIDKAFCNVIEACATIPRHGQRETWITKEMRIAYSELHERGIAHSVEVWQNEELIGGLYGVACGRVFTGESMFSVKSNASKIALIYLMNYLQAHNYYLLDCQLQNPFLKQFGVRTIPRLEFLQLLAKGLQDSLPMAWNQPGQVLSRLEI